MRVTVQAILSAELVVDEDQWEWYLSRAEITPERIELYYTDLLSGMLKGHSPRVPALVRWFIINNADISFPSVVVTDTRTEREREESNA